MTVERDEGFRAGACELVKRQLDPHCGCTEEEWETPWGYLGLHLSAGKPSDAHLDDGESEREITLTVATVDEARSAIFGWASALLPAIAAQPDGGVEADLRTPSDWVNSISGVKATDQFIALDRRLLEDCVARALAASAPAAREGE